MNLGQSVDPLSFFALAESLANAQDRTEAHERSAISRYYYALMLYLRDNIRNRRFREAVTNARSREASIHSLIGRYLQGARTPDEFGARPRVAWYGEWTWLLALRERADYDIDQPWTENMASFQERLRHLRDLITQFAPRH